MARVKNNKTESVLRVLTNSPADISARTGENAFDLDSETQVILNLQSVAGNAILEIGRRLIRVKENLEHGAWLNWLGESLDYSERTAQNLMRLAREYENPELVAELGSRKALALLAVPSDEREAFAVEIKASEISARELEDAIKARDAALKERDAVKVERDDAKADLESVQADNKNLKESLETARTSLTLTQKELEDLKSRPIDVATEKVIDQEAINEAVDAARREEQDKAKKEKNDAEKKLNAARDDLKETRDALKSAQNDAQLKADENKNLKENLEKIQKELDAAREQAKKNAAPVSESESDLAACSILYAQIQENLNKFNGFLLKIEKRGDIANAVRLKKALSALAEKIGGDVK